MSGATFRLESDVRDLLLRMLRMPSWPAAELVRGDIAEWDSLKHMEIIFALEDCYAVQFDESEFPALDTAAAITAALQRHLAA